MRLWYCLDHESYWPVGCASIVWALNEDQARVILGAKLDDHFGKEVSKSFHLTEVNLSEPTARVLLDGEY